MDYKLEYQNFSTSIFFNRKGNNGDKLRLTTIAKTLLIVAGKRRKTAQILHSYKRKKFPELQILRS